MSSKQYTNERFLSGLGFREPRSEDKPFIRHDFFKDHAWRLMTLQILFSAVAFFIIFQMVRIQARVRRNSPWNVCCSMDG